MRPGDLDRNRAIDSRGRRGLAGGLQPIEVGIFFFLDDVLGCCC
jgi:hypothetical protein